MEGKAEKNDWKKSSNPTPLAVFQLPPEAARYF